MSTFAKGIYFNRVKPETPDSVKKWKKGSIAIHRDKLIEHLKEQETNDKGYINYDLVENEKDGEKFLSFKLNDWKPASRDTATPDYPQEEINPADIPF